MEKSGGGIDIGRGREKRMEANVIKGDEEQGKNWKSYIYIYIYILILLT